MKNYKELNIRGALLDKNQLGIYMEKIAAEHNIANNSIKNTYPISKLISDYRFILETYKLLNRHIKLEIKVHSAGEWILDNFYIIEEAVKSIEKELNIKKYKNMIGISNGRYKGFARAYVLAEEIVAFTDCKIDRETIDLALNAYQRKRFLSMEEINNIGIFLKISIISHIKEICEKIYSSQIQKYRVENIIERIVEQKNIKDMKFINSKNKYIVDNKYKYPFIEYMSYRLKKYGKKAIIYQEILEKEVEKLGLTISDVIQKEHFSIANLKITIGNCIKSIRDINRINFNELFGYMNVSEEILKLDPANVYNYMDQESKGYYRRIIENISKKTKISEIYISEKIIELSRRYENYNSLEENKKAHVGYYLVDKGLKELKEKLEIKSFFEFNNKSKEKLYIASNIVFPLYFDFIISIFIYLKLNNLLFSIITLLIMYVPISEIFVRILNYLLSKFKSPTLIPKINYEKGIPEENSTFIIIPTILKSKEKVKEMIEKLEVYYLANKSENLYFALLGDCSEEDKESTEFDDEVIKFGINYTEKMNQKYKKDGFNRFHFLYRKRTWSNSEKSYIGWERKRGLIVTFNNYIKNKIENNFLANTIESEKEKLPNIKYIITLDSDTNLNLESAGKLIGAMSHVLNKPIIKDEKVVDGYGIMQPRIGMDLELSKKSYFVELYSLQGGIDFYTNAISDIYQDYFKEGIFTGKGIYDVDVYNKILENEIPENTVLSHDLLEGNFLRCGLITDIMLLDGYPTKYIPYVLRNHRWVRGDWQIIRWLKSPRLNKLSKYKIYDNLRRSLIHVFSFLGIFFSLIIKCKTILLLSILSIIVTYILDIINYIIFKESTLEGTVYAHKKFSKDLGTIQTSAIKIILELSFFPYQMYKNIDAIIRSIYRMKTRTKLLEWVTAEDGEKKTKTELKYYYNEMKINWITGILSLFIKKYIINILGILWILGPIFAWYISLEKNYKKDIGEKDKKYLEEIGKKTWEFFEDYINEENNYLMIDNYQESRNKKIVDRTSSTNIGLEYLAIISAYDLGFIKFKKAIEYIESLTNTVNMLSKWNGHLYNWYNTKTLMPLIPRYISTVDSGNFVGYLYIVKQFLIENKNKCDLQNLIDNITSIIENTDFSKLYSNEDKLLSIGFNLEDNKLTDSYYDFLASEARQASLVAIAKKDIPVKHWNNLSRTLTNLKKYKGLISWTGTAFEYLMPNINIKRYPGSLLDEASKFAVMSQIEYAKKLGLPWGISESAFNLKDLNNNYQYKAFGVPWLGLKRGLDEDWVISPYSTFLSLEDEPQKGTENLRYIEDEGGVGKYGFYESIDYTPSRLKNRGKKEVVKTYMAHHQGLILLSINNLLNNNILKRRFSSNPEIEAVDILLQERMPKDTIITKERKEKVEKNKTNVDSGYVEYEVKENNLIRNINVISNEKYKITLDNSLRSVSEYDGKMINNYKETSEIKQGIFFYIKNVKNKKIIKTEENCKVIFAPDKAKFSKIENNLKIEEIVTVDPNKPIEIRRLEIENLGNNEEIVEIISEFEPTLSYKMQEYSHPAFNKLFLKFEEENENIIVEKRDRELKNKLYLVTNLYTENEQIGDFEYEIDKERYYGREENNIPIALKNNKVFSNNMKQVVDPVISMKRTIKIYPKDRLIINLLISISEIKEEAIENLENIKSEEEIIRTLNIAKIRSEEESKYLRINSEKLELYQKFITYVLNKNIFKENKISDEYQKNSLWKYGISGDLPIILVEIESIEYIYVIEELISCFEYYRAKGIYIDLVILNNEKNIYDRFIRENINEVISNKQLQYLINVNSGIFIINKNEMLKEDLETLEFKSNIILNSNNGGISNYIKECEEKENKKELIIKDKNKIEKNTQEVLPLKKEELLFDNEYGGFSLDGREYKIIKNSENKLPAVWCNIISNSFFGTLITDNLGGFTWSKNSRLNRLTAWNNNSTTDFPSEIFYISDINEKTVWTLNTSINANQNYYYITHGFGYTKLKNTNNNFMQELTIFVPNEESLKINYFNISNLINEERELKLLLYLKPVLGEDEISTNGNICLQKIDNIIEIKNVLAEQEFKNRKMYIISNEKIKSFTGEKENFFGNGCIEKPDSLYREMNNKSGLGKNSCIAIEIVLHFDKLESKKFYIGIGEEENIDKIKEIENKYNNINSSIEYAYEDSQRKWNNLLDIIKIKTPSEYLNILINGWVAYQTISSRIYARSAYYQSGGAFGFRDQLQDALGIRYIDSSFLKKQIINSAEHQFVEGDVLHWWHAETKKGVRTRFSDDLLWLVYAVYEYVEFENDDSILFEEVEYIKGDILKENENEKYNVFYKSGIKDNIYNHCKKAIDNIISRGIEGFPKIGVGDWNDGFSNIGSKGKGESIWLGFFLYDILNKFIVLSEKVGNESIIKDYEIIKENLKRNLNTKGWDGRWYKRAITDDGDEIGSINSEECRIDSIAQSWSVISGAGDNDKKFICMQEAENYLVDRENKLIKLFDPAFEKGKVNPGYIKAYPPGIRENGGQYTHASIWLIMAEAILGFGDKAVEFAEIINPINHAKTKEEARKFKLEPYVMQADIYSNKDLIGRGGWNWYTGSSSWYFKVVVEYILGLKIENGFLFVKPCISKEWKEYEIKYKYKTSIYNIKVKNQNRKNTGVSKFILNNNEIIEKKVLLQDNGKINNIEIIM